MKFTKGRNTENTLILSKKISSRKRRISIPHRNKAISSSGLLIMLLLFFFLQSCISVQSMRYKRGLNISIGSGKHSAENVLQKKIKRKIQDSLLYVLGDNQMIESSGFVPIKQTMMSSNMNSDVSGTFAVRNSVIKNKKKSFESPNSLYRSKPAMQKVLNIRNEGNETKNELNSAHPENIEEEIYIHPWWNILLYGLYGSFTGLASLSMIFLFLILGPISLFIWAVIAYFFTSHGRRIMKRGRIEARYKSFLFRLLYFFIALPGYIICGIVFLLSLIILRCFNVTMEDDSF